MVVSPATLEQLVDLISYLRRAKRGRDHAVGLLLLVLRRADRCVARHFLPPQTRMRLILPRHRLVPATVASFTLSGGCVYASSSFALLVSSCVTAFSQNRQFSRTTTLLFSSSRFRDDESSSKYDALKEELRNAEFTTSTMQGEPEAAPSPPDSFERGREASTFDDLLGKAMGRAARTISTLHTKSDNVSGDNDTAEQVAVQDVIDGAAARADRVLSEKKGAETSNPSVRPREQAQQTNETHHIDRRTYLSNPCVTPTALAHSLWKSTVRPNVDTVIDATCGNGKDSVALAEILFASLSNNDGRCRDDDQPQPELVCIDLQSRAVANTTQALQGILDEDIYNQYCRVMAASHAPLPKPRDSTSVGLVCYNLGWLPGSSSDDKDAFATKTFTTMISLTDAALLLRVGGLLSVMTYPGACSTEADAVRYFCEGLAMLTTRDKEGWEGYVDSIPPDSDGSGATTVRDIVRSSLERVVREGNSKKQTWRAYEHKPLGRPLSPILIAAMRIK